MDEKVLTLRHQLPRLIEAARVLGASVLVMLLMTIDEECRKQDREQPGESERGLTDRS